RVLAAVVALLAGVPTVGVVLVRGDAGDHVVAVQLAQVRRGLDVGLGLGPVGPRVRPAEARLGPVLLRRVLLAHRYLSSLALSPLLSLVRLASTADRRARVSAPEDQGAQHPDDVHQHDVQDHRLRRRGTDPDGAAARRVAVVTAYED